MENKSIDRFIGETETRLSILEQRIEKQDGLLQDIHSLALTMRDITHVLESTVQKKTMLLKTVSAESNEHRLKTGSLCGVPFGERWLPLLRQGQHTVPVVREAKQRTH